MTMVVSVMGPAGAPMKARYGSFSGKPGTGARSGFFSVMGPAGAPMKVPYGSFAGKTFGVVAIPHNLPIFVTMGKLKSF